MGPRGVGGLERVASSVAPLQSFLPTKAFAHILGALSVVACAGCIGTGRDVGPLVTRANIQAIQLGMDRNEVEALLGSPFSVETERNGDLLLIYSRRPLGVRWYPMLSVHLRDGKVAEVYAKRYGLLVFDDDIGIYVLSNRARSKSPEFDRLFPP